MNTHIFIVNEKTFKCHLEYMFAGTGANNKSAPFLSNATVSINASTERNLVGMLADVSRIQIGDNVIFYLQATKNTQGQFFGVFTAKTEAFFDENDNDNFLKSELNKGLSFRILLGNSKYGIFPKGITEHEYLDKLDGKKRPYELCWSLIYRKLKGNRGCTMIMDYEFNDLLNKLKSKNESTFICDSYSFDQINNEIIPQKKALDYEGKQDSIDITKRLLYKANRNNAFETHLQAYIIQNVNKMNLLPIANNDYWIGNEVSCGVGMQRIDILIKQETDNTICFKLIELKDELPTQNIVDYQLDWYIKWLSDYVVPNYKNKKVTIKPCIIAKGTNDKTLIDYFSKTSFDNPCSYVTIEKTEYLSFIINENKIDFKKLI